MILETSQGPLYCYKSEFTPPVHFIASVGPFTIFEDNHAPYVRTWRRLKEYCTKEKVGINKLRIGTPHQVIDCEGTNYKAFYSICRVQRALHEPDNPALNGETKIYAVLNGLSPIFDSWSVWTIFDADNWAHVGFHTAPIKEYLNDNSSELDRRHAIGIGDNGVILFQ